MSYQLRNPGSSNRSCKNFEFSSVMDPDRTSRGNTSDSYTRDIPIQFISSTLALSLHGEMDGRINESTWLVWVSRASEDASRTLLSLSLSLSLSISVFTQIHEYWSKEPRYFSPFSLISLFSFTYSRILFPCSSLMPLGRSLQVLENLLHVVWKYTFIFEES